MANNFQRQNELFFLMQCRIFSPIDIVNEKNLFESLLAKNPLKLSQNI